MQQASNRTDNTRESINLLASWAREPHWPDALSMLAVGCLYAVLPPPVMGNIPRWLLLAVIVVLLCPTIIAHRREHHALNQVLGYILNGVVTAAIVWALALLIRALPVHKETSVPLLICAGSLWVSTILVFASWYWRLDAGGPHERDLTRGHAEGAFLFPQMTMYPKAKAAAGQQDWAPNFVDYLFVAFNTSTAFSPTDTPVLSRWAKILVMIQSAISILLVILLAARAVNIF